MPARVFPRGKFKKYKKLLLVLQGSTMEYLKETKKGEVIKEGERPKARFFKLSAQSQIIRVADTFGSLVSPSVPLAEKSSSPKEAIDYMRHKSRKHKYSQKAVDALANAVLKPKKPGRKK